MLASKAFGPPKGVVGRLVARLSVEPTRVLNRALAAVRCVSAAPEVPFTRALWFPNVSQQTIWASQGGAAEGDCTMFGGGKLCRTCGYSSSGEQNPESVFVPFKSLMFSKC